MGVRGVAEVWNVLHCLQVEAVLLCCTAIAVDGGGSKQLFSCFAGPALIGQCWLGHLLAYLTDHQLLQHV